MNDAVQKDYLCAKCGFCFKAAVPMTAAICDIRECKDGEPVGDVLLYVCDDCAEKIAELSGNSWP